MLQKSLLQENKNTREELLRKIEELKTEIELNKEKIASLEKLSDLKAKELEETKIKLHVCFFILFLSFKL